MIPRRRFLPCCIVFIALPLAGATPGQFARVRDSIQKQIVERGIPSIAVAVARDGEIVWEEGFGWADREKRVPSSPHVPYSLASISKPFTATALMLLVEQGKIDLDRPLNDYLGEAKVAARIGDAGEATIRRVANHTSGLPLHYNFFFADEPAPVPSYDETIRRYGILVTPPGERYQYSNLGFGLLGYVVSRVSGAPYADFMRRQVFIPLGLTHTAVGVPPRLEDQQAIRYALDGAPLPFYDFDHPAASAIYACAHDLVRFGMFHLKAHLPDQKPILSDRTIDEMRKPTAKAGRAQSYGIGWNISARGAYQIVSHSGGMGGVSTILRLVPSKKIAVVVLCNANAPAPATISDEILAALLPDFPAPSPAQELRRTFQPSPELVGRWKGTVHTYKGTIPLELDFRSDGDVHARLGSEIPTLLNNVQIQDGYLEGRLIGDIGTEDARRHPYWPQVSLKQRGEELNGAMTTFPRPGPRPGNGLSHWVELRKQQGAN